MHRFTGTACLHVYLYFPCCRLSHTAVNLLFVPSDLFDSIDWYCTASLDLSKERYPVAFLLGSGADWSTPQAAMVPSCFSFLVAAAGGQHVTVAAAPAQHGNVLLAGRRSATGAATPAQHGNVPLAGRRSPPGSPQPDPQDPVVALPPRGPTPVPVVALPPRGRAWATTVAPTNMSMQVTSSTSTTTRTATTRTSKAASARAGGTSVPVAEDVSWGPAPADVPHAADVSISGGPAAADADTPAVLPTALVGRSRTGTTTMMTTPCQALSPPDRTPRGGMDDDNGSSQHKAPAPLLVRHRALGETLANFLDRFRPDREAGENFGSKRALWTKKVRETMQNM